MIQTGLGLPFSPSKYARFPSVVSSTVGLRHDPNLAIVLALISRASKRVNQLRGIVLRQRLPPVADNARFSETRQQCRIGFRRQIEHATVKALNHIPEQALAYIARPVHLASVNHSRAWQRRRISTPL